MLRGKDWHCLQEPEEAAGTRGSQPQDRNEVASVGRHGYGGQRMVLQLVAQHTPQSEGPGACQALSGVWGMGLSQSRLGGDVGLDGIQGFVVHVCICDFIQGLIWDLGRF